MSNKVTYYLRLTHKWTAIVVAVPLIFLTATGIFLQVRKPVDWIQPGTAKGVAPFEPQVTPDQVLTALRGVPEAEVETWSDLKVLDFRPEKGIIKVRNPNELETQVDASTGEVIKTQQRRNDFVNSWHDGSAWGMRLSVFLIAAVLILYLGLSGLYLSVTTTIRKLRRWWADRGSPATKVTKPKLTLVTFSVRYHYWIGLIVFIPWLIVVSSGLVLQLRHEIPGVATALETGIDTTPKLTYSEVLDVARTIPELKVEDWPDIWRVYTYPNEGVMMVRTTRGIVAQIDAANGTVLSVTPRSADFWEDVHQGTFGRHSTANGTILDNMDVDLALSVFLPVHLISLLLWMTGVVYFFRASLSRRRSNRVPVQAEKKAA